MFHDNNKSQTHINPVELINYSSKKDEFCRSIDTQSDSSYESSSRSSQNVSL